jgi:hypothetical protein
VPIRGRNHIDGVFVTDANLDAAIAAGANELWLVWTVSTRGRWRGGPVAQYFQVIEACANGRLRRDLDRIARSNAAHAQGRAAEYPHPVRVRGAAPGGTGALLFVFTRSAIAAAVERGVAAARQWCGRRGSTSTSDASPRPGGRPDRAGGRSRVGAPPDPVRFRERLAGPWRWARPGGSRPRWARSAATDDPAAGGGGRRPGGVPGR